MNGKYSRLRRRVVKERNIKRQLASRGASGRSDGFCNTATGPRSDESWIYAYDPEIKQQSTGWEFQDEPNPPKVTCAKSTEANGRLFIALTAMNSPSCGGATLLGKRADVRVPLRDDEPFRP
ncbi:hypothetical protein EVAR_5610_1 [Eumeta japonica]|uniref:Uncharacterized protein n=1 Tax=Eumeta variegata TaxID=151549 RepID=A0A4C1U1L5_EUMVA|nr:hypothetical protein EVAR_5610_1 [Eumeta japonica]